LEQLEYFAGQEAARLRRACAWGESGIEAVDIEAEVHAFRLLPGNLKGVFGYAVDAKAINVGWASHFCTASA
jgi:hypothetical protein